MLKEATHISGVVGSQDTFWLFFTVAALDEVHSQASHLFKRQGLVSFLGSALYIHKPVVTVADMRQSESVYHYFRAILNLSPILSYKRHTFGV